MRNTAVQMFATKVMALDITPKQMLYFLDWYQLALEMEKQQIIQSHINGQSEWDIKALEYINKKLAEDYYKETYEKDA